MESWIETQFSAPESPISDAPADVTNLTTVQQEFFYNAMNGGDQLRQRVAFALSKIWVVSGARFNDPAAIVPYLRVLQKHAFGNYYDLMSEITLNPAMGRYLDMANNVKPNPALGRSANENYARELLQLFTIGTYELNPDGSRRMDGQGRPIQAYGQPEIVGFARAFTGWTYPPVPGQASGARNPVRYDGPMVPFAANHDTGEKMLLGGTLLPAGQSPEKDLAGALSNVFHHPNVGPFIGKQLIQQLVTSNPSPEYVSRVASAFADNGQGVRGDMRAVIRAVLLDPEARMYDDSPPPEAHRYGHLREPVLLVTGLLRRLGAGVPRDNNLAGYARNLDQNVYFPPTVFSYFAPGYEIPGAGALGPEFQLLSPSRAIARLNFLNQLFFSTPGGGTPLDLSAFTAAAREPEALVRLVNQVLMAGAMTAELRQAILQAVNATTDSQLRAKTALYLAAASGAFQVVQ